MGILLVVWYCRECLGGRLTTSQASKTREKHLTHHRLRGSSAHRVRQVFVLVHRLGGRSCPAFLSLCAARKEPRHGSPEGGRGRCGQGKACRGWCIPAAVPNDVGTATIVDDGQCS